MRTPEQIVEAAKHHGNKRSVEYWLGALDVLRFRFDETRILCPYREGTVEFDAYHAGNDRGHALWRELGRG